MKSNCRALTTISLAALLCTVSVGAQSPTPQPSAPPAKGSEQPKPTPAPAQSAPKEKAAAPQPGSAANGSAGPKANANSSAPSAGATAPTTFPNIPSSGTGGRDIAGNFSAIDRNGDGQISEAEYRAFLQIGKTAAMNNTPAGAGNAKPKDPNSAKKDANHPQTPSPMDSKPEESLFQQLDTDHNGFITTDELSVGNSKP